MSRLFYHVMQDNAGNLLFNVTGTMRIAGSGTLATIYGDEELTVLLPNPMTNHPSYGSFKCFLGAGAYDFSMAKAGYTFETLTGVQGHGTMALQNADAVAITDGTARFNTLGVGAPPPAGNGQTSFGGHVSFGIPYSLILGTGALVQTLNSKLEVTYQRASQSAISVKPSADTGGGGACYFYNAAGTAVGTITTTGAATAYNTTSDARLKHDVAALTGALDVVQRLRPITHLWNADDSRGYGFLAHEVAEVVDGVITGDKDATNPDGTINPQMIDYSKLVPWLVGACKELAAQVEALTARLEACGG